MRNSPAKQVVIIVDTFCQTLYRKYALSVNGIMNK